VRWSIVAKEEPADGSPYFARFPSDRMLKATNDAKVHLFIHSYYTTGIISANSRNILKLLRLVSQLTVEQLVLLTLHSYFLDDRKRIIIAIITSPSHNTLFIAPTHTAVWQQMLSQNRLGEEDDQKV
jgi:hypothetical protein